MKVVKALTIICLCLALGAEAQVQRHWALSENQLNIPNGGRTNSISLNPINADRIFIATESGGLFYSDNRGATWTRKAVLDVTSTQSVVYKPTNSNVLYASAKVDYKTGNGGGVYIGGTNGDSWRQANLDAIGSDEPISGYEISVQRATGYIYAGTSQGAFRSQDQGVTWTHVDVFGGADKSVYSVLATDTHVYYGGPRGVRVENTLNGALTTISLGAVRTMHAFGTTQAAGSPVFAATALGLAVTRDSGTNWIRIYSAPAAVGTCKGFPFARMTTGVTHNGITYYDLYYSNGCSLHKAVAEFGGPGHLLVRDWDPTEIDSGAPRDLAIERRTPKLLGSSSGAHRTADLGQTWHLTGAAGAGLHALEIHEVKGQRIPRPDRSSTFDLYVGTQDNGLWAVDGDSGNVSSYSRLTGHHIEMDRVVQRGSTPKITFAVCPFSCLSRFSERLFANVTLWPDVPNRTRTPVAVRDCNFVQGFRTRFTGGIAETEQCGMDWQTFATFTVETREVPQLATSGFGAPHATTILYQAYKPADVDPEYVFSGGHLLRAHRELFSSEEGEAHYPRMWDFGYLGVTPTMRPVFTIDPGNPDHVIAADVYYGDMKRTTDGGDTWASITSLSDKSREGGLQFAAALNGPAIGKVFSLITAVSFSPQDPSVVLAGAAEGGIYVSNNNGVDWNRIPGTEGLTNVTSFAWETANRVHVSTFGRGLWLLENRTFHPAPGFDVLCGNNCRIVPTDGSSSPLFDHSVLVFDGTVLGVRREEKQVREVFVTSGSSVVFTGEPQDGIVITESDGTGDYEPLPQDPDKWIAKGIVMTADGLWTGTVYGEEIATLVPPPGKEIYSGPTQSPTQGKPYVVITADEFSDVPTVAPNGTFALTGTDFIAGVTYEILVDGELIKESATADGKGSFAIDVVAPSEPGYHRVDVREADTGAILDASVFSVRSDR